MKVFVLLHDRCSKEPIIIRVDAINVVRNMVDVTGRERLVYCQLLVDGCFLSVVEDIETVMAELVKANRGELDEISNNY